LLFCAAVFGIIVATLCGLLTRSLRPSALSGCACRGVRRALLPAVTLILAWSLKNGCQALGTGDFLTALLAGRISPYLFPPLLFVVASITSFATGTSWGTMAILLPTAIPIAFALDGETYGTTTVISLGAVLDGAIFGDHCSPISDTTIISSTATDCDLLEHVRTQLPYSVLVAIGALSCAYVPSALGLGSPWSLALAFAAIVAALLILSRRRAENEGRSPPMA
jgi:Na+/H+ antiporter NhaC